MDLQPSAPYASASSFPSPTRFQMNTDPLLSLEKLHDLCHGGGSASSASNVFPKFAFPNFSSSSKAAGIGIDLTSDLFSASTAAAATNCGVPSSAQERIRSSTGPYFSPNKIAHRSPGNLGGTDCSPRTLPSPPTSGSSTLQGILQRCGLSSSPSLDLKHSSKNHLQQDGSACNAASACITQKIRNLDEILRNLDHYSMSKRFTITAKKEVTEPFSKKRQECPEPDVVQHMPKEQLMSNADHGSETLGGSVIPDGITHINKSISRMEFRAQMEKLTGIIDDRWPGDGRVEKAERVETKTIADAPPNTAEPSSVRNVQEYQEVDPPPQPVLLNGTNASAASTNILEEMLRNISGLERRLAKRERSKQTKKKGFLAKGKLWVQRPAGKRIAAMLQRQFKRHAASVNQRLDKTDLVMKSLRRQREEALSPSIRHGNPHANKKERKSSRVSDSSSNIQTGSPDVSREISSTASEKNLAESRRPTVAERCMEACESLSRSMQCIQDQLCTLQRESQQMGQSLETIQKQSSEQSMEIELCWTAINHLCIDNETFREELQGYHSGLHQQQE